MPLTDWLYMYLYIRYSGCQGIHIHVLAYLIIGNLQKTLKKHELRSYMHL